MHSCDGVHDRQPQAMVGPAFLARTVRTVEALEDATELRLGEHITLVFYSQRTASFCRDGNAHHDLGARPSMTDGVAQKIAQCALKQTRITGHDGLPIDTSL